MQPAKIYRQNDILQFLHQILIYIKEQYRWFRRLFLLSRNCGFSHVVAIKIHKLRQLQVLQGIERAFVIIQSEKLPVWFSKSHRIKILLALGQGSVSIMWAMSFSTYLHKITIVHCTMCFPEGTLWVHLYCKTTIQNLVVGKKLFVYFMRYQS